MNDKINKIIFTMASSMICGLSCVHVFFICISVSLELMGGWGHSCLLLVVEIVKWSLVLPSSESVLFVRDGEEHGLSDYVLVMRDEGFGCMCCLWVLFVWYHSVKEGVPAACLSVILLVVMVLKWD